LWYPDPRSNVPVEIASPAYVLRTRPYGELDVIATLLTATHGKITGIAKAAKHSRRRFGGTLQPFVHVRAVFPPAPARDLAFLVRCELLDAFRRSLSQTSTGSRRAAICSTSIDRMTVGRDSGPRRLPGCSTRRSSSSIVARPSSRCCRAFELHLLHGERLRTGARSMPSAAAPISPITTPRSSSSSAAGSPAGAASRRASSCDRSRRRPARVLAALAARPLEEPPKPDDSERGTHGRRVSARVGDVRTRALARVSGAYAR
jgi:hypothetical protein